MQRYQFDKIYSVMENEFGKIYKGGERPFEKSLFILEGNLLKTHRKYPSSDSRRLREAIALTLFTIKENCSDEKFNTDNFRNDDNERLEQVLLKSFDPFSNTLIWDICVNQCGLKFTNKELLWEYYYEPVICILRIKESVDMWEKNMGPNGYFNFLEDVIGDIVSGDELDYMLPEYQVLLEAGRILRKEEKIEKKKEKIENREENKKKKKERSGLMKLWPF